MYHKNDKRNDLQGSQGGAGEVLRVRLPRGNEVLGILEQRLGANHMMVKCLDGKSRVCRVPGRLRRKLWLREGDTVLVEPWELGGEEKGDIIWKYHPAEVDWLKRKGFLKAAELEF
ncbi:MAG: translation initiation factor eIF-1A [Candidatus Pacearchaeota archaeon]|nr:translation initiation factor eIF-1A [Candidatus Pacearchaeota archaeon]